MRDLLPFAGVSCAGVVTPSDSKNKYTRCVCAKEISSVCLCKQMPSVVYVFPPGFGCLEFRVRCGVYTLVDMNEIVINNSGVSRLCDAVKSVQ